MGKLIRFKKKGFSKKDKKKTMNKEEVKKIVIKVFAFIGGLITAIYALMQAYDWIREHKKLDIVVQDDISITYLNENIMQHQNFYPLFEDYVDSDKEYLFTENCATQLMITNHYNNQVVIDKIILEADEIEVDYSPILTFYEGYESEDGLSIFIANTGWGAAKDLNIRMVGKDKNLEEYLKRDVLEFTVPIVEPSEQVEVPFLKNSDLLEDFADGTDLRIDFEVECQCEGIPVINGDIAVFMSEGKLVFGGAGDYAQYVYGIRIDTAAENFSWEKPISEFIDQGETLVFPICFFPDKSCSLNLKISFEIVNDGKTHTISTETSKMYFTVSSIPGWNYKISKSVDDVKSISKEEMEILGSNEEIIVTYPESPAIKVRP